MEKKSELGKVTLTPEVPFVAGTKVLIVLTYIVGKTGIKTGGKIRINLPPDTWTPPVWLDTVWREYYKPVNIKVEIQSKVKVNHRISYDFEGVFVQMIDIKLTEGNLQKGDKVILTYGNREYGSEGIRAQTFPEENLGFVDENFNHMVFDVFVDTEGNNQFSPIKNCHHISVIAGQPGLVNIVSPSIVQRNKPCEIKISLLDKCRNRPNNIYTGEVILNNADKCRFKTSDNNRKIINHSFDTIGINRIAVSDTKKEMTARSNPVLCVEDDKHLNLYWGDIHGHSKISDGANTPDEYYQYGRDMAGLDICALTDHEACFKKKGWKEVQELAEKYYQPEKFVTFKAFEWTSNTYGHYNVYYRKTEIESILANFTGWDVEFRLKTSVLFDLLRKKDVLIIPHHTLVATEWDSYDSRERLVEVYSCWGRSEYPGNPGWDKRHNPWGGIQNALKKGYRLGIIGGSDTHDSFPGRCYPGNRASNLNYKGGLMAVYAPRLTRDAIFDALFNRHCYATTGERIILDFKIDEHIMGDEIEQTRNKPRIIKVIAAGTADIDKMEIVRNNTIIASLQGNSDFEEFEYTDVTTLDQNEKNIFYYVRVIQKDGEMAWSSPIWIGK